MLTADDRLDIAETKYLYGFAVDTRDYELLRAVFDDHMQFDMTRYRDGAGAWDMSADAWVDGQMVPLLDGLTATQHSFTNPIIDATESDDHVRLRMHMQAHHVLDPEDPASTWTVAGWYDDRLRRSPTAPRGWVISTFALVTLWERGDSEVLERAVT